MDIRYVELSTDNILSFEQLLPEQYQKEIVLDNVFGVGAVVDDNAAGVCLYLLTEEGANIRYMLIHPEYRRMGLATQMFSDVLDYISEQGMDEIHVFYSYPALEDVEELLTSTGFVSEIEVTGMLYEIPLSSLAEFLKKDRLAAQLNEMAKRMYQKKRVMSFCEVSDFMKKKLKTELNSYLAKFFPTEPDLDFDPDMTTVSVNGTELASCCIVSRLSDGTPQISVLLATEGNNVDVGSTLYLSLVRIIKEKSPSGVFYFNTINDESSRLAEKLVANSPDQYVRHETRHAILEKLDFEDLMPTSGDYVSVHTNGVAHRLEDVDYDVWEETDDNGIETLLVMAEEEDEPNLRIFYTLNDIRNESFILHITAVMDLSDYQSDMHQKLIDEWAVNRLPAGYAYDEEHGFVLLMQDVHEEDGIQESGYYKAQLDGFWQSIRAAFPKAKPVEDEVAYMMFASLDVM